MSAGPASKGLAAILERVRTVVAALTPDTDADTRFELLGPELGAEAEPGVLHRRFEVRPLSPLGITGAASGIRSTQFRAQFELVVMYDPKSDRPRALQIIAEDAEQITNALDRERWVGVKGATPDDVHPTGRTIEGVTEGATFWRQRFTFDATYRRDF